MREAHHRIQNNLALVASLLQLQRRRTRSRDAQHALLQAASQVLSVAHIHRVLQDADLAETIDLQPLLALIVQSAASLAPPGVQVRYLAHQALIIEARRAAPLAMICTELMTNALKHNRPDGDHAEVTLAATLSRDGTVQLSVTNTGPFAPAPKRGRSGLGLRVVNALLHQINARLAWHTNRNVTTAEVTAPPLPEPAAKMGVASA